MIGTMNRLLDIMIRLLVFDDAQIDLLLGMVVEHDLLQSRQHFLLFPLSSGLSVDWSRTADDRFAGESSPLRPGYKARRPPCEASTITFRVPASAISIDCK